MEISVFKYRDMEFQIAKSNIKISGELQAKFAHLSGSVPHILQMPFKWYALSVIQLTSQLKKIKNRNSKLKNEYALHIREGEVNSDIFQTKKLHQRTGFRDLAVGGRGSFILQKIRKLNGCFRREIYKEKISKIYLEVKSPSRLKYKQH